VFRASSEDEITFGRFIKEGDPTITITGNVSGASEYRVEFTALVPDASGQERPLAVHVQRFEGGTVSVKAPATFEHPLYVVVQDASIEPGKGEAPRGGALQKPIVLEGKDISFTIAVAEGVKMPFGEALPEGTPLPGPAPAAPAPAAPAPAEAAPAAPAGGPG
jgi:hypothetical protein